LKKLLIGILIISAVSNLFAVEINLHIDGIVDNREYFGEYDEPGTIFGLREAATVQFGKDSIHQFRSGAIWFQEFGSPIEDWPIAPLINYRFRSEQSQFTFGSFLRKEILFSPIFFDERYDYERPQVEGFDYQYRFPIGVQSIWVDWDSRQSTTRPEHFYVGISGIVNLNNFSFTHHLLYRHLAGRDIQPHDPVGENGGAHIILAFTDTTKNILDTLQFTAEMIGSYNRNNRDEAWNAPLGFEVSSTVVWNRIGVRGRLYKEVIKSKNGHQLEQGAPFYNAPQFGEIDILLFPIKTENISMSFDWSMTFVGGEVENRQHFLLTGDFGKKIQRGTK